MIGDSLSLIKLLYLVSLTPRGQHLSLRIVNSRRKVVLGDREYAPFPFLAMPKEKQGEIVSIEVEFPRNRRLLQGVPCYELDQAEVTVRMVREDHPAQILQSYSGTFVLIGKKMWITQIQESSNPPRGGVLKILRWNTQSPTRPGWYWLSEDQISGGDGEPAVVEVVKGKFGLEVHFLGTELTKPVKKISGQWSGPIPHPEDT